MAHDFLLMDVLREDWFATAEGRLAARFRASDTDGSQPSSSG
jgi:hypothetical protein